MGGPSHITLIFAVVELVEFRRIPGAATPKGAAGGRAESDDLDGVIEVGNDGGGAAGDENGWACLPRAGSDLLQGQNQLLCRRAMMRARTDGAS